MTGNIGLHHVHHLSARIPNYNLQAAHEAGGLEAVTKLSLRDGLHAVGSSSGIRMNVGSSPFAKRARKQVLREHRRLTQPPRVDADGYTSDHERIGRARA